MDSDHEEEDALQACTALVVHDPDSAPPAGELAEQDEEVIRARPRQPARRRINTAPARVLAEYSDDDEDHDLLHCDDEPEEEAELVEEGEKLLGKYDDIVWKLGGMEACQRDQGRWIDEDPKIRWDRVLEAKPELNDTFFLKYFCAFFPYTTLPWWCKEVTQRGRAKYRNLFITRNRDFTPGLFFVFIGNFFYMAQHPGVPRRAYFNETAVFPEVAHNLSRFGLTYTDFEHVIEALELPQYTAGMAAATDNKKLFAPKCGPPLGTPSPDEFVWVRRFIDTWNAWIAWTYISSHILNPDETMIRWLSKYGLPGLMFVRRKPDPLGHELKNVSDALSRIMVWVELQEGKDRDRLKNYVREYGATTAFALRLVDAMNLVGKGKKLIMDSWFGSVKASALLLERGTFLVAIVKTNTKFYPLASLKTLASTIDKKTHSTRAVSMTTDLKLDSGTKQILALYHLGPAGSVLPVVATCGISLRGADRQYDAHQKLSTGERKIEQRVCTQPGVVADYKKHFHIIDDINQQTNQTGRLDEAWKTHYWPHRDLAKFLNISKVNALNAWGFFGDAAEAGVPESERARHFTNGFIRECYANPWLREDPQWVCPAGLEGNDGELRGSLFSPPSHGTRSLIPAEIATPESDVLADDAEQSKPVCFLKGIPGGHAQKCTVSTCKAQCYMYCVTCHDPAGVGAKSGRYAWICGPRTGRECFKEHVTRVAQKGANFTPKRKRVAKLAGDAEELAKAKKQAADTAGALEAASAAAAEAAAALKELLES
ncbi:hypothetical protein CYMTET_32271 [Cymbomonas tetramitiformis]|uniref:PiggyBac transposable element-derived protein domain-containing protein n=1 Tax=Cymbomonas tetramitiformis TaxID=36881 RepID=A0AAE0KSD8_9CHLO|nr:hypothetical protein CYMTET_32271 [Cymbomonas tetramitiformis]